MIASLARASLLARAFDYPYGALRNAFVFDQGCAHRLRAPIGACHVHGAGAQSGLLWVENAGLCLPVLAVGSNANTRVLRSKFGSKPLGLVQGPVHLPGFAAAHSAHVARYGALPATLVRAPGGAFNGTLQLVPVDALGVLDASEAIGVNYNRVILDLRDGRIQATLPWLRLDGGLRRVAHYASRHGVLRVDGQAQMLRRQKDVLRLAKARAGLDMPLNEFVEALVRQPDLRQSVTQSLKSAREPLCGFEN